MEFVAGIPRGDQTRNLVASIHEVIEDHDAVKEDPDMRKSLLGAARKLVAVLETPVETIFRFGWQPHQNAAIRVAIALDLFALVGSSGRGGVSAADLASTTRADKALIVRIMRALVVSEVFTEVAMEQYAATPISDAWVSLPLGACSRHLHDVSSLSLYHLPEFLSRSQYQNPADPLDGPFQFAFDTDRSFFQWLDERPDRMANFNTWMEAHRQGRKNWFHSFPVERLNSPRISKDPEAVMLVDIGGGYGHDLEAFRNAFPECSGRLILEDVPKAINELPDRRKCLMEAIKYDFCTPQPIIGARAYYFRSIFHAFSDSKCLDILRCTTLAMERGYSKMLINDWVLPDKGASFQAAMIDMNVIANLAGKERTESQWKSLLDQAGLLVVEIWGSSDEERLIEAVLK
ncbi:MAG: hypothetical protein LQ349_002306 [Xanthoria aureola]|nr:MAG: hypothetical protein LQ349_002306 [Xanthoria aureola]